MKLIPALVALTFALSLCGLTDRLTGKKDSGANSNSLSSSSGSSNKTSDGAPVERPSPTSAQQAKLDGGQSVSWDQQGISWTLPAKWTKQSVERTMFHWRSPGSWEAASLIVNISVMDASFPIDSSLKAYYDSYQSKYKNGEVDEVRWLELDGVRGVSFRESNPEKPDDPRRLQWIGYRTYAGQTQMVNLMLATQGKHFPTHQDALYAILYSTKMVK